MYDFDKSKNIMNILNSYKPIQYWFYSNNCLYFVEIYWKPLRDYHKFVSRCLNTLTFDVRQSTKIPPQISDQSLSSSSSSSSQSSIQMEKTSRVNIKRPTNNESVGIPCKQNSKFVICAQKEKTHLDVIVAEMMSANESTRMSVQSVTLGGDKKIILGGSVVDIKSYFVPNPALFQNDQNIRLDPSLLYPQLQLGLNFPFIEKTESRNTLTVDDSFNAVVNSGTSSSTPVVFSTSDQLQNVASLKHMLSRN